MVDMVPVCSSNIQSVGYDQGNLLVDFKNGRRYVYHGVSLALFNGLVHAPSVGKFFDQSIKNRYPCDRLD